MIAPNKNRGWLYVLALVFPYLIVVGLFQVLGLYLAGVDFSDTGMSKSPLQTLIIKAFDLLGTLLLLWVFMRYVDKLKFIKLGFQALGRGKEFSVGIVLGIVIMFLGYMVLLLTGQILFTEMVFN